MAAADRAAVQITFFRSALGVFAAGGAIDVATAGRERFENGVEVLDDGVFATNHLAVATFEPPDSPTGANVNVVDSAWGKFLRAADVVDIVGIAAIDQNVVLFELGHEAGDGGVDHGSRNHQPDGTRLLELGDKIIEGSGSGSAFARELIDGIGAAVVHHA